VEDQAREGGQATRADRDSRAGAARPGSREHTARPAGARQKKKKKKEKKKKTKKKKICSKKNSAA